MKVKIFSTQMGEREIETNATTWGALQKDLKRENISFSKMKAVIGENKLTLEAEGATLPVAGFTLFLMNKKTKAGVDYNTPYKEIRASIKEAIAKDEDKAKAHFNVGKNYTTKGTEELRGLLAKWKGVKLGPAPAPKKKAKKTAKKGVKIGKNNVPAPKRGFDVDKEKAKSKPKKKNSVIEKAKKAVAEVEVEQKPKVKKTVVDVVESVKESKTEEVKCTSLQTLDDAVLMIVNLDISEFGEDAQDLLNMSLDTVKRGLRDFKDNFVYLTEKIAKKKAEAEAKAREEEAKAKALAEEEAEAKRVQAEEDAKIEAEEAEKARVAQVKADKEAEAKEKADAAMREMRDMFSDVK